MKKLTAIILTVILALSVLPVRSLADYSDGGDRSDGYDDYDDDDDDDGDLPDKPIVDVYDKTETLNFFDTDNCRFIVITNNCCITVEDDDPFENAYSIVIEKGSRLVIKSRNMKGTLASIICEGELEIAEGASLSLEHRSRLTVLEKGKLSVKGELNVDNSSSVYCFGNYEGEAEVPKAEIAGAIVFRRDYSLVEIYDPYYRRKREWQITDRGHEYYGALDAKKMLPKKISTLREQSYTDGVHMDFIFLSSGKEEWHIFLLLTDGRTLEMAVKGYSGNTVSMCGVRFDAKNSPLKR